MRYTKTNLFLAIAVSFFLWPSIGLVLAAEIEHHGFLVDDNSDDICVECHGENAPTNMERKIDGCLETNQKSHPIHGVFPPKGKESKFRTLAQAKENGIRFENGKLTCLSCHNLKKAAKGHLTVDNSNSRLCMACHKM